MSKKKESPSGGRARNLVAKYAQQFNRAHTHRDQTAYARKAKHNQSEPFPLNIAVSGI